MRFKEGKHYMCIRNYTGTGSKDNPDWKRGRIYKGGMRDCLINDNGNNVVMLDENGDYFRLATQDEIDGMVKLEDGPLTYKQLMADAEFVYHNMAQNNSPFCAQFEARKYIASKIDECIDRSEHLDILQWDEYKEFAPLTSKEYERRKALALQRYEDESQQIENDWVNKGKHSPDYHKI